MRKPADNEVNMYMLNHCGSRLVLLLFFFRHVRTKDVELIPDFVRLNLGRPGGEEAGTMS